MIIGNIRISITVLSPALRRHDAVYKESMIHYIYHCAQQNMFLDNFCDEGKTYLQHCHISTSYECARLLRSFEPVDGFPLILV